MRARTALLLPILAAVAALAALDRSAIATPTEIHLLFARGDVSAMLETRRCAPEFVSQQQLADAAETARDDRGERPAPPGTTG